ncbi:MAG: bifunctional diaminohydroxyphosphoribosylaminopyrimidine deaminase/5-amino-6-(5-phosphoribosylamino)uracil reductase RibD [Acidobacteriota bacterium]|nr:bifunctional diaminohydroxyphosphoribosylaminopyrimidine deaminase/5-amino-6-(5-phosphoribosylamino)uracil reductase RibD [Acidobacteriota bacterium]
MHLDDFYMARALALAERGRGRTSPNPMVGAVVVDAEGVVVGAGSHEIAGGPHAEVHALRAAGERARGATLYCTLEPCSHVGRTGPCAPLVADAGISRVVVAVEDPNPRVRGSGMALLRERGVQVAAGVCCEEARALNRPFFSVMLRHRPFVTMKVALSQDGFAGAAPGVRTALTGPAANRFVHRERAEVDAIAVGSGTVLCDDPLLTARGAYRHRPLTRIIFDTRLRTPAAAKVLSTLSAGPVIIVSTPSAAAGIPERLGPLRAAGADVLLVATSERADLPASEAEASSRDRPDHLRAAFELLAARGLSSVIVEGGVSLHRSLWASRLVDRVQMFRTPHFVGTGGVEWLPSLATGRGLAGVTATPLGADILIEGHVHWTD